MIVPLPTYLALPDELLALPSMKTVPLIVRVVPFQANLVWPSADVQLYAAPVRSNGAAREYALSLIVLSAVPLTVSNLGGVPVLVAHGDFGPRPAFRYQKPM
jgi:hypothetical protein